MADSDSDGDLQEDILMDTSGQPAELPKKKAHRKDEKYIHEDADTIVDLADIKAMGKISCKFKDNVFCPVIYHFYQSIFPILFKQHQSQLKMLLVNHRLAQSKRPKMKIVVSKQISVES